MTIDNLPTNVLSSEYGKIILSGISDYIDFEVKLLGISILNERYYSDAAGMIYIQNIGELAVNVSMIPLLNLSSIYKTNISYIDFEFTFTPKDELAVTGSSYIYLCNVNTSGTVDKDLLISMPLSLISKKRTGLGRKEFISFYGMAIKKVYIARKTINGDVGSEFNFAQPNPAHPSDGIFTYDISPSKMAIVAGCNEKDLIYYNVYQDVNCIIRYTIDEREYPYLRTFVFINSFLGQETFHSLEDAEAENKWNRTTGYVDGVKMQFRPESEKTFTVKTGFLRQDEVKVFEELLDSQNVAVIEDGELVPVVITTESVKESERKDMLISFEFSYQYADNNLKRTRYVKFKKPGVFDKTFDGTFN